MILTMRPLPEDAGFFLDGQPVGEYVEAVFYRPLGIMEMAKHHGMEFPVWGFELELTLCGLVMEPQIVEFRTSGKASKSMFQNRQFGESLKMWPCLCTHRDLRWCVICINGEVPGLLGPRRVNG